VEEQPEVALTRSGGGGERRLASSRSGFSKAALDQDKGRNVTRRGWRSWGAGKTERLAEGKRMGAKREAEQERRVRNERAGKTAGERDSVGRF
jgi:hypothetical protein